jgi:hypothetical protein
VNARPMMKRSGPARADAPPSTDSGSASLNGRSTKRSDLTDRSPNPATFNQPLAQSPPVHQTARRIGLHRFHVDQKISVGARPHVSACRPGANPPWPVLPPGAGNPGKYRCRGRPKGSTPRSLAAIGPGPPPARSSMRAKAS